MNPTQLLLALPVVLAALPAAALDDDPLSAAIEASERQSTAKAPVLNWRATQVNRCADAKGKVALQDLPCAPPPEEAASAAAEVVELSALAPRLPPAAPRGAAQDAAPTHSFARGLLDGAWKLALIVLACCFLLRFVRARLDAYRYRRAAEEVDIRHGPRRVR